MTSSGAQLAEPTGTTCTANTVVRFPEGLPGFEHVHEWQLVAHDEALPFFWVRAVSEPSISLLVIDPNLITASYDVTFSRSELARVGLGPTDARLLLVVVTLRPEGPTANLRAPLVIDPARMVGAQIILDDPDWPLRHPVFEEKE